MADGMILVAVTSVLTPYAGRDVMIVAGRTTAREGHPILEGRGHLFTPLVPVYEVESKPVARAAAKVVAKDG